MFGLALSVGASGAILTSPGEAFAADSSASNTLPSKTSNRLLDSVGSNRLSTSALAYHTVIDGETLWDIATEHGADVAAIKQANGLTEDAVIKVGQVLKIPSAHLEAVADSELPSTTPLAAPLSDDGRIKVSKPQDDSVVASSNPTVFEPEALEQGALEKAPDVDSEITLGVLPGSSTILEGTASVEANLVAVERSPLTSVAASAELGSGAYEVQSGDTLWSIARDHQISPEVIAEANGIRNPERIFVGRALVIPLTSAEEVQASIPTSRIEVAASQSLVLDIPGPLAPQLPTHPVVSPSQDVDPYVANLLADVSDAQDSISLAESSNFADDAPLEIASESTTLDYGDNLEASLPINPQFPTPASRETHGVENPVGEQLLAAAPLGSDVYAPITENPAGRVVSPGMPILPDSSEYLPETPSHFSGYVWPAQGVLTSGYGWRWGRMHQGIDVAGPVGTPIVAAAPGVVARSGWNSGGYGNLVEVRHPDGSMTRYAHNSRLLVESGQQVRQGQQIAEMGSTGFSTGPHLHFEIHLPNDGVVNPMAHLPSQ
jgi:murein DD-endopeptidase MepM/ murein hydrolase activator NlpD